MMYQEPEKSPWGKVQICDLLCPGVFLVSTASHGGTMVSKEVAAFLSPAATLKAAPLGRRGEEGRHLL